MNKMKRRSIVLSYLMLAISYNTAWALKMKVFMQVQCVWSAVDPNDPKSTVEDKTDKFALAMIYQGIPEDM